MSFKIQAEQKRDLLDAIEKIRSFIEYLEVNKNCYGCAYFKPNIENCEKFMQKPPEHIIKGGCPDWELLPSPPF